MKKFLFTFVTAAALALLWASNARAMDIEARPPFVILSTSATAFLPKPPAFSSCFKVSARALSPEATIPWSVEFTTLPTFAATPLGLRAEFRPKDATISAQIRNIANVPYTTVPGLLMPGPLAVYGVRWTFWN